MIRTLLSLLSIGLPVLLIASCSGPPRETAIAKPYEIGPSRGRVVVDSLMIRGAVVMGSGAGDQPLDLLLGGGEHGELAFLAIAEPGEHAVGDTLDASGLYVHSASAFEREVHTVLRRRGSRSAMYVLRAGRSPGSEAKWLVLPDGVKPLEAQDNYPPGPISDAVGCFTVQRGQWEEPDALQGVLWAWVPDDLRLHWQYHWAYGRGKHLVATGASGEVPSHVVLYRWSSLPADSLKVVFGWNHEGTTFMVRREGDDYVGNVRIWTDAGGGTGAPVRLDRRPCPAAAR